MTEKASKGTEIISKDEDGKMQDPETDCSAAVPTAVRKKKEEKMSRRDPRSWDNISKQVTNMNVQEKSTFVQEKYIELFNEFRKVLKNYQTLEKSYSALHKEKEQLQAEQTRSILAKATMESLCRELQKQNKQIKDDNLTRLREEEEKRKEVAGKFTEKLNDISKMMDVNNEKSFMLQDANKNLTERLAELHEQYKERDFGMSKLTKEMDLRKQLSDAQIQKLQLELSSERKMWQAEQERLKALLEKSELNCQNLQLTVTGLKDHVEVYKGQYSDIEDTMTKSNKVFENFKGEISEMGKKIKHLEKDSNLWKSRYQTGAVKLLELSQVNQNLNTELSKVDVKVKTLTKLCRQLQTDRGAYLKQLQTSGIQPVQSAVQDIHANMVSEVPTDKQIELAALKENLKVIQDQLATNIIAAESKNSDSIVQSTPAAVEATTP